MQTFYNPTAVHFGVDSLCRLPELLGGHEGNVLFVHGKSLSENMHFQANSAMLKKFIKKSISAVPANPDITDIFPFLRETASGSFTAVLAIGGGSVIDSAKAICALQGLRCSSVSDLRKLISGKKYRKKILPLIAVPTTAGTGSEANQWAVIWDRENKTKLTLGNSNTFPLHALVDPKLTYTMPLKHVASTGLDTLSHAVEGLWSKSGNEISRIHALRAAVLVLEHLESALKSSNSTVHRDALSLAATLGGISLSVARTSACHAMSYPLTLGYNIPHGVACALSLGEMYQFNKGAFDLDAELLKVLGHKTLSGFVRNVCTLAGMPGRLADYGVKRDSLTNIAADALKISSIENNVKQIDVNDLIEILKKVY